MFPNRREAGRRLARRLRHLAPERPVVLALPRGGVPVAFEIAAALDAPLDLVLVRKIGVPWQPELALGAVVDGASPQVLINESLAAELGIDEAYVARETAAQLAEIERRRAVYLGDRPPVSFAGATAVVVDDGIATGSTMRIALRAVRRAGASRVVLAVPVAPADTLAALRAEADEIVCLEEPSPFIAVGAHYVKFPQLEDADVVSLLEAARSRRAG
ncbi:MAG TPA: phosphoribosyltransferase family protein [Xanthobacteraceae bacterium]|jgi:putative phosphoribosyl transferase|nr:phosphoribosyltransferase family protein [Stellaceae bacterium]